MRDGRGHGGHSRACATVLRRPHGLNTLEYQPVKVAAWMVTGRTRGRRPRSGSEFLTRAGVTTPEVAIPHWVASSQARPDGRYAGLKDFPNPTDRPCCRGSLRFASWLESAAC